MRHFFFFILNKLTDVLDGLDWKEMILCQVQLELTPCPKLLSANIASKYGLSDVCNELMVDHGDDVIEPTVASPTIVLWVTAR